MHVGYNVAGMLLILLTIGYHFTATGAQISHDACGGIKKLSEKLKSGYHGSGLTLDFRSNRIHSKGSFYLGITCTLPSTKTVQENSATLHQKRQASASSFSYSQSRNGVTHSFSISCSSSQNSRSRSGTDKPATVKEYFVSQDMYS